MARSLRSSFLNVLSEPGNLDAIQALNQFLRTYVLIDKVKEAGQVFRAAIVEPFLNQVILLIFICFFCLVLNTILRF
jgi:hypothetical protein